MSTVNSQKGREQLLDAVGKAAIGYRSGVSAKELGSSMAKFVAIDSVERGKAWEQLTHELEKHELGRFTLATKLYADFVGDAIKFFDLFKLSGLFPTDYWLFVAGSSYEKNQSFIKMDESRRDAIVCAQKTFLSAENERSSSSEFFVAAAVVVLVYWRSLLGHLQKERELMIKAMESPFIITSGEDDTARAKLIAEHARSFVKRSERTDLQHRAVITKLMQLYEEFLQTDGGDGAMKWLLDYAKEFASKYLYLIHGIIDVGVLDIPLLVRDTTFKIDKLRKEREDMR